MRYHSSNNKTFKDGPNMPNTYIVGKSRSDGVSWTIAIVNKNHKATMMLSKTTYASNIYITPSSH